VEDQIVTKLTRQSEERIRLGSHADTEKSVFGLFVDLGFPVVDIVLLGNREIAHDGAFRVKEFDFGTSFDKAVGDLQFRLKFPCGDTLFLYGEVLRQRDISLH
jgi:hypothetical protein